MRGEWSRSDRRQVLADDTLYLDINQDIAVQLLPFDDLMKAAVSHSPLIKYQNEVANSLSAAERVTRTQILQNVSGFGNYSGGNQSLNQQLTGVDPGTSPGQPSGGLAPGTSLQLTNGYRVGVDIRLSLFDVFGRKHLIRQPMPTTKLLSFKRKPLNSR